MLSMVVLNGPWLPLLAPYIHTAVPLKVTEAEAPNVVVRVNVSLPYLRQNAVNHRQPLDTRREVGSLMEVGCTHDCQKGSLVDPSCQVPGEE